MADQERGGDYDDWFDEPEPLPEGRRRGQRRLQDERDDPWLIADDPAPRRPRPAREPLVIGGRTVTQTQLAIVGACAVAVLLAILAAAGVFSGGSKATTPTLPRTTARPPAVTPTTPTTSTKPRVAAPASTLKPGDTGAQVTLLQKALASLGYSPGKADGSYGPGTKTAVTDFQTAQGLTADGVVGPKTLAALKQTLAAG
jgi:peptidoglycan hydrolase-like protein with peptidoglycan-binding domain